MKYMSLFFVVGVLCYHAYRLHKLEQKVDAHANREHAVRMESVITVPAGVLFTNGYYGVKTTAMTIERCWRGL